jgi:hypothetical protein
MSNRYLRRRELAKRRESTARFKQEAGGSIITHLVAADEPLPVALHRAVAWWCNLLSTTDRHCLACDACFIDRHDVAGFLLSQPSMASTAVSVHGVCSRCWSGASIEVIEEATTRALSVVVPRGALEAMQIKW